MFEREPRYTARDVREIRLSSVVGFSQNDFWYINSRGFHKFDKEGVDHGYLSYLPSFEGLQFEEIINRKIEQHPSQQVNILDVGCGRGDFLKECIEKWNKKVNVFGIDLRPEKSEDLDLRTGDMHNLDNIFPLNSMDIITSVRTLEYAADPWFVVKKINRVLRPGGTALLSYVPFNMNKSSNPRNYRFDKRGADSLASYLRNKYAMEVQIKDKEYCNLSFRKITDRLFLPLTYSGKNIIYRENILAWFNAIQYTVLGYKFQSKKSKIEF